MHKPQLLSLTDIDFSRYAGLIFDCDGTLTDSMPLHYIAWRETMATVGIEFPESRFYSMGGMPSEKIIAILSTEQNRLADADQLSLEKESAFFQLLPKLRPIDVVCQIARDQHGQRKIAVASGGIREAVTKQLERIEMLSLFPIMVTAEDTELHKPEPDVFLETARRMDIDPTLCLVFEDSPLGFAAAESAGMDCVDVRIR
jgi:beta-phosphoglucomutase-like phosphatase (HAD superfamily)